MTTFNQVNILGTSIAAVNMHTAMDLILSWLQTDRQGRYICATGVHGIMEALRDKSIHEALNNSAMCVPDGMPLTWIGRSQGHKSMDRVYGPDLMLEVLKETENTECRHFFYGGKEGIAEELEAAMLKRFPAMKSAGTYCPPFRPLSKQEEKDILQVINNSNADILWVGLSTPKQELTMQSFSASIQTKVMFGVGAAFDFHTGHLSQAPHWIQKCGLEWAFRMITEPRRLAGRYLRNNPAFIYNAILQMTGLKKYPRTHND